jgi:hypothetical protein
VERSSGCTRREAAASILATSWPWSTRPAGGLAAPTTTKEAPARLEHVPARTWSAAAATGTAAPGKSSASAPRGRIVGRHSPIRDGSVVVLSTNESDGVVGKRQNSNDRPKDLLDYLNPFPYNVDDTVRTGKTHTGSRLFCMGRVGCTWAYRSYSMEFLLFVKKD